VSQPATGNQARLRRLAPTSKHACTHRPTPGAARWLPSDLPRRCHEAGCRARFADRSAFRSRQCACRPADRPRVRRAVSEIPVLCVTCFTYEQRSQIRFELNVDDGAPRYLSTNQPTGVAGLARDVRERTHAATPRSATDSQDRASRIRAVACHMPRIAGAGAPSGAAAMTSHLCTGRSCRVEHAPPDRVSTWRDRLRGANGVNQLPTNLFLGRGPQHRARRKSRYQDHDGRALLVRRRVFIWVFPSRLADAAISLSFSRTECKARTRSTASLSADEESASFSNGAARVALTTESGAYSFQRRRYVSGAVDAAGKTAHARRGSEAPGTAVCSSYT